MQVLLRRDYVIKNIESLSSERICMPAYSIPFPRIKCLVVSLTALRAEPILLCIAMLWECRDLTAVLKYEEIAKTEGFPCGAVTSCSSVVTFYVVVDADTHS